MGVFDIKNKVPTFQRQYQAAHRQHVRIWSINPRSKFLLVPYVSLLFATTSLGVYGLGRKALGYNSYI